MNANCCRSISAAQLLDDFKLMALNRNEKHQRNRNNCNYIHDDGWGIVLGKSGNLKELYKKNVPCWKDSRFLEYYNANPDFLIVHARRAAIRSLLISVLHIPLKEKVGIFVIIKQSLNFNLRRRVT